MTGPGPEAPSGEPGPDDGSEGRDRPDRQPESPTTDGPDRQPESPAGEESGDYEAPVGTLFLLMVYVMVLVGMWVTMYWMLVSR